MIYITLFFEFFKIGLFAVGGGIATLPFLYEIADKYVWLTSDMLADIIAISESTPGPLGINMATYAGYEAAGIPGAITATISLTLPSFLVVITVCKLLNRFSENRYVKSALAGLRPSTVGLVIIAWLEIVKTGIVDLSKFTEISRFYAVFDWRCMLFAAVLLPIYIKFKGHPLIYIAAGAAVGIIFKL